MATIQVLGRLAKEVKEVSEGKKIVFTVADNTNEDTQYFDIIYGNFEKLTPLLTIGKEVLISGNLVVKKNETEKGTFTNLTIYAANIQLTGSSK